MRKWISNILACVAWVGLWTAFLCVAFPALSDAVDKDKGYYYNNWHTDNVDPNPIATLTPETPLPTIDPEEQGDDGDTGSANVSNNRGISYILQMCSNNAKEQRKFWNEAHKYSSVINAGWLYGNTSNLTGCRWSKAFMQLAKPKRVRVHICNCTCFKERGRKCGPNECFPGADMTASKANNLILNNDSRTYKTIDNIIAKAVEDHNAAGNTIVDYAVSPCLESTLSLDARKKMMNYIITKFTELGVPSRRSQLGLNEMHYVDNPLHTSECIKKKLQGEELFCEAHGDSAKRGKKGIADLDGISYDEVAQAVYGGNNSKAWMVLIWKHCLNGSPKGAGFIYPNTRVDWCDINRDAANMSHFTDDRFTSTYSGGYANADLKNCGSFRDMDSDKFVWKLGEGRNFTTTVMPTSKGVPAFQKMFIMKDGKQVDVTGGVGRRVAQKYHDTNDLIYDFQYPLQNYPDGAVLHGRKKGASSDICWKFPKPSFRPFRNPNLPKVTQ